MSATLTSIAASATRVQIASMLSSIAVAKWHFSIFNRVQQLSFAGAHTFLSSMPLSSSGTAEGPAHCAAPIASACRPTLAAEMAAHIPMSRIAALSLRQGTFASAHLQQRVYIHSNGNKYSITSSSRTLHTSRQTDTRIEDGSPGVARKKAVLVEPVVPSGDAAHPWYNVPNALSVGRGLSGPVIGYWIMQDQWTLAVTALVISGATDWLDGYVARRFNQRSIVGSYLDPLGDKVLIGSVAAALTLKGIVPLWVAGVIVGRDVGLVAGMFILRASSFGWRWPGFEAFFKTGMAGDKSLTGAEGSDAGSSAASTASGVQSHEQLARQSAADATGGASHAAGAGSSSAPTAGVPFMQPLMISKANTVLQLVLVAGYIVRVQAGWPDASVISALEIATVTTTIVSSAAYARQLMTGRVLGAAKSAQ